MPLGRDLDTRFGMSKALRGKSIVITGSTSGIGWGLAEAFADAGASLIITGLEQNGPDLAAQLERAQGVPVRFIPADLRVPVQVAGLIEGALSAFGQVDVLINNAGIQHVSPIEDFSPEKWEAILAVNLSSAFYATRAAFPSMKKNGFGRIINIASVHGLRASEFKAAYVAAKHGLIGLTKVIALEGAAHGITANAICPGYVKTPLVDAQIEDQARTHGISADEVVSQVLLKKQAVKKFVGIDTISNLALYLASESAQTVTGASFPVDAGWTAQ